MSEHQPQAYPLCWPPSVPRTRFRESGGRFQVTMSKALDDLYREAELMGAEDLIISSNLQPRLDGRPRANQPAASDPGIAFYFTLNGEPMCVAIDKFDSVVGNIRAVGLSIEAMRGLERWGGAHMVKAAFTGFTALPPPERQQHWTMVLDVPADATVGDIQQAWKQKIREIGGAESPQAAVVNVARDLALKERAA